MALGESLPFQLEFRVALAVGFAIALAGALFVTPKAIRKLRGAGIVGRDRNKPSNPEVAEMGGLAVFLAFNAGVFAILTLDGLTLEQELLVLVSLIVIAGATITGILDDLVVLRQRFKAFIPLAFAAPLALYVPDFTVWIPVLGSIDFGLLYPLVLVPVGIACASNGFNMLEGFNGLGTGLGIILAVSFSILALVYGNPTGLVLLVPLIGALAGFFVFNKYPSQVFPGDTMTLMVGAVLAAAAVLSKIEFWGALLFIPHVVEFFLKAKGNFRGQCFATGHDNGILRYEGPVESLTHLFMKLRPVTEKSLSTAIWIGEGVFSVGVILLALSLAP